MTRVAGATGFGGNNGIGAGLDVGVVTKTTTASIGARSVVQTGGSVEGARLLEGDLDGACHLAPARVANSPSPARSTVVGAQRIMHARLHPGHDQRRPHDRRGRWQCHRRGHSPRTSSISSPAASAPRTSTAVGRLGAVPVLNKTTEAYAARTRSSSGAGLLAAGRRRQRRLAAAILDALDGLRRHAGSDHDADQGDGFSLTASGSI